MRIAYLITRMDSIGGAQIHVRDLCIWLQSQGHTPVVICGEPGKTSDLLTSLGIEVRIIDDLVRPIRPAQDFKALLAIKAALQDIKPDILSCHSSKTGILGRIAAKMLGIPAVFTAHGWAFTAGVPKTQAQIYRVIEKLCGPLSKRIVTVSDYDRDLALSARIAPSDKIVTIHNGMPWRDSNMARPDNRKPQLVMVARFGPQKDHKTLLLALAELKDLPWDLHLIGGGDNTDIVAMADELALRERIVFHGERTDLPEFLEQMDIFLLISHWEGFPRSILEAMRARLPVIATKVAGVPESVRDQVTGRLVAENDVPGLRDAIKSLLSDKERRKRFGEAGRESYEDSFTFLHMAQPTLALYQEIVAGKHGKDCGHGCACG